MGGAASQNENELVLDVQRLAEPAFAVNHSHHIVAWNDAAERLLGLRADQMIGQRCYEALSGSAGSLCVDCHFECPPMERRVAVSSDAHAVGQDASSQAIPLPSRAEPRALRRVSLGAPQERHHAPRQPGRTIHLTTLSAFTHSGDMRIVHLLHADAQEATASLLMEPPAAAPTPAAGDGDAPSESGRRRTPMPLTQRELEVLRLLGAGRSTEQIAEELSIARVTARNHVNKVLDKLGVSSRLQAVVVATHRQLI